jgi:hypothetical protein
MNSSLRGPESRSEEEKNVFTLPEIEGRFLGLPARSLVTIPNMMLGHRNPEKGDIMFFETLVAS